MCCQIPTHASSSKSIVLVFNCSRIIDKVVYCIAAWDILYIKVLHAISES